MYMNNYIVSCWEMSGITWYDHKWTSEHLSVLYTHWGNNELIGVLVKFITSYRLLKYHPCIFYYLHIDFIQTFSFAFGVENIRNHLLLKTFLKSVQ